MYNLHVDTGEITQPWLISLSTRIQYILKNDGRKACVILYDMPDSSTFRYRGYNIYQNMQRSKTWKTVYFFAFELSQIQFLLPDIQIVVASRTKWTYELQKFIDKVKDRGIPFLFDVDDRIFDLEYIPLIMNSLNVAETEGNYDFWFSYISRIERVAGQADAFISTNKYLTDALNSKFGKKGYVIPNILNKEQVDVSQECVKQKIKTDDRFGIGYFSGSPSHINDFKMVYKDIIELMEKYNNIYLYIVGYMEFPEEIEYWIKKKRVKCLAFVDFIKLQILMAQVDVNIVPLLDDEFTNCKSELKYFEAAIVDTITCASPVYTYRTAIENEVNGFLCRQSDWYDTLERIYLKETDTEKIIKNARNHAMKIYYGESVTRQIEDVYETIVKR